MTKPSDMPKKGRPMIAAPAPLEPGGSENPQTGENTSQPSKELLEPPLSDKKPTPVQEEDAPMDFSAYPVLLPVPVSNREAPRGYGRAKKPLPPMANARARRPKPQRNTATRAERITRGR